MFMQPAPGLLRIQKLMIQMDPVRDKRYAYHKFNLILRVLSGRKREDPENKVATSQLRISFTASDRGHVPETGFSKFK